MSRDSESGMRRTSGGRGEAETTEGPGLTGYQATVPTRGCSPVSPVLLICQEKPALDFDMESPN